MILEELKTKRIGILGLGVNNVALVAWLLKHRAGQVTVCDHNPAVHLEYPQWHDRVRWRLGSDYRAGLTDFEIVFRTPGIPYLSPDIQQAKKAGVVISSQTKLFFELSPAPIIGVTGTKGKGTTATLIYEILRSNYEVRITKYGKTSGKIRNSKFEIRDSGRPEVFLAGNIGKDPFEFLDNLTPNDWVVLELSSFQLQDMDRSPRIAVVLDITSDHLDHHQDRAEYVAAKTPIVRHQERNDWAILNVDSATTLEFAELTPAPLWYFSRRKSVDQGAFVQWTVTDKQRRGEIILRDSDKGKEWSLLKTSALQLRGEHNLENVTAAITAAYLAGAHPPAIKRAVAAFVGLPHRLELIGHWQGRQFYNDSFSTNPEPMLAALKSFSEPVHLLVGGSTKGADFGVLANFIRQESTVASVIPLGVAEGVRIAEAIRTASGPIEPVIFAPAQTMAEAVETAIRASRVGDVILLSPGAASFDLFPNYKVRGEAFCQAVTKLPGSEMVGGRP